MPLVSAYLFRHWRFVSPVRRRLLVFFGVFVCALPLAESTHQRIASELCPAPEGVSDLAADSPIRGFSTLPDVFVGRPRGVVRWSKLKESVFFL